MTLEKKKAEIVKQAKHYFDKDKSLTFKIDCLT